jgi:CDP-glycerol glycerophosphotransferase (TagB/SpsB family)
VVGYVQEKGVTTKATDNGIYYFLGNITSHILHALPLYNEIGGTFIVLSEKAKREVEAYGVPVIALDNKPRQWVRFGPRLKPVFHYLKISRHLKKTSEFLNENASVVIFYELYDFDESVRITKPKTIFLTHGNMLKDYMGSSNRLEILNQYDYMAALSPYLKDEFIKNGISPMKLIELGIARTDEIVKNRSKIIFPKDLVAANLIDINKPIISYMPTFWGASSIYGVGKDIVRYFPEEYTLLFRPHPQTPTKLLHEYLDIIAAKSSNIIYAPEGRYKELGLVETFNASSAIIGDVSSVMLEAVLTDKPLVFAYDTDDHRQDEKSYESIREIVSYSERITPETKTSLPLVLANSLKRGIDRSIWSKTKDRTFYHHSGDSVTAIADFIRTLL